MMLAITIEHAVTKPMVRLGGADLTEAGSVSVAIRRKFYSTLLHNADANIAQQAEFIDLLLDIQSAIFLFLRDDFLSCQRRSHASVCKQHERTSQALCRNSNATGCFPC